MRPHAAYRRPHTTRLTFVALSAAVFLGLAATGPSAAVGQSLSPQEREMAERVREEAIREVTVTLAGKDMEGRGTAQPGGVKAAKYLADRFAKIGLKPLGDQGTYLQAVPFEAIVLAPGSSLTIEGNPLTAGKDYCVWVRRSSLSSQSVKARAKSVFVTYAALVEGLKTKDLASADVKGKIAVVSAAPVKGPADKAPRRLPPVDALVLALDRRGAAGVLVVVGDDAPLTPSDLYGMSQRRRVFLTGAYRPSPADSCPVAFIRRAAAKGLFAKSSESLAGLIEKANANEKVVQDLGVEVEMSQGPTLESVVGHNVVGLLEGADPQLKGEAVVYSAHYDAWGKDLEGRIFPGAADNALGVAKMLAVAEAMSQSPHRPRRSVIFLAPTGEEHHMLGTRYWLEHPTWPIPKIAANLNFDGIDTETYGPVKGIYGEGLGLSDLDRTLSGVAADMQLLPVPDLNLDRQNAFERSDQYEFAQRGVPTVYVFGLSTKKSAAKEPAKPQGLFGRLASMSATASELTEVAPRAARFLKSDYHQPSDVVRPEWDWEGVRTMAVFYLAAGLRVANAEKMPEWLPHSRYNRPRGSRPEVPGKKILP